MSEPDYYTASSLCSAAGVSLATLKRHQACDVGQITKAREKVPGLGLRYKASACRKYLSLVRAGKGAA